LCSGQPFTCGEDKDTPRKRLDRNGREQSERRRWPKGPRKPEDENQAAACIVHEATEGK